MIKERNIAMCIILSIVTFGIYGLVWFFNMNSDARTVSGDNSISGGKAILFSLLTCGLYMIYWNYKMGKTIYQAEVNKGMQNCSDNSTLYLILSIFGLAIVSECLIQNELNKFATVQ